MSNTVIDEVKAKRLSWQTLAASVLLALIVGAVSSYLTTVRALAMQTEWNRQHEVNAVAQDQRILRNEEYFRVIDRRLSRIEGALGVNLPPEVK